MIYVIVENNVVINRTKADQPLAANWIQSNDAQIGWSYDSGTQTFSAPIPEPPIPEPPTPADIAAERYKREIAGISIDGMFITTDDRSKTLLNGKFNRAILAQSTGDASWSANWKVGTNWITLSAAQIIGIGVVVDNYIQACFDHEGELVTDLLAGDPVDIQSGWPSREITT